MPASETRTRTPLDAAQTEAFVAAVWNAPGLAVALFDAQGCYVAVNRHLAAANRRLPDDHCGRSVVEVPGGETGTLMLAMIEDVAATGAARTGVEICDDERTWETAWLPMPDVHVGGVATGVACVAVEVTDARVPALLTGVPGSRSAVWTGRLLAVAQALGAAGGPDRALDEAFGQVAHALGAKSALVGLLHDGALTFRPDLSVLPMLDVSPQAFQQAWPARVALDDPAAFSGAAVRTGQALWFPDVADLEASYPASVSGLMRLNERAWASVPIHVDGDVIGVLRLSWATPQTFTTAQKAYVQAAADHAGQVLQRLALVERERAARVAAEVARRNAEQARARSADLLTLAQGLSAAYSPLDVAEIVLKTGLAGLSAVGGGVGLLDEEAGVLRILAATGGPNLQTLPLTSDAPFVRAAISGTTTLAGVADLRHSNPVAAGWMAGIGSVVTVAVPLRDEHRTVGSLSVHFPTPQIDAEEAAHLEAVAALAGQALARAFAQELAQAAFAQLQRALLPSVLPTGPGVRVCAGYRAAPKASEIGGDFYDTVPLPGGGALLLLGDVQGHDLVAAALMAQLRAVMHSLALSGEPPAEVLAQADTFLARVEPDRLATALVIEIQPDAGLAVCASAGHLPPVLVEPAADGGRAVPSARVLDIPPGLPLGMVDRDRLEHVVVLPSHARLVLATDGLVERRTEPITDSLARLATEAAGRAGDPGELVVEALLAQAPGDTGDDAAVMVVDLETVGQVPRLLERTMPARVRSAHLARRWAQAALSCWGIGDDAACDVVAVVTELAANGARAASRSFTVILRPTPGAVVVGVRDDSHRMPHKRAACVDDVDGRGLEIVEALAQRWWVEEDAGGSGKTVWAAVHC